MRLCDGHGQGWGQSRDAHLGLCRLKKRRAAHRGAEVALRDVKDVLAQGGDVGEEVRHGAAEEGVRVDEGAACRAKEESQERLQEEGEEREKERTRRRSR